MANSDKNILITPNVGATTEPTIRFTGANNTPITLRVLDTGTLSFEATAGQLFSISDGLTGSIFSVSDVSGIPSIEVLDSGLVKLAQYNGAVVVGGSVALQSGGVNAELSVVSGTASTPGVIIQGVANQTANVLETRDSGGTARFYVSAAGTATMTQANLAFGNQLGKFAVWASSASIVNQVLRGANNQTADQFQVQANGTTVLAGFNAVGQSYTGSTTPVTLTTGGATTAASGDGTTATITTTSAHGLAVGDLVTVAGVTPTGYNGTFLVTAVTTNTLSYANTTTGSQTVAGTVNAPAQASITARSAGTTALNVRAAATPIGDIFRVESSTGSTFFRVLQSGAIETFATVFAAALANNTTSNNSRVRMLASGTTVDTAVAANVALTVQNTNASPSADLTQWKNTSGTVFGLINPNGQFAFGASSLLTSGSTTAVSAATGDGTTATLTTSSAHNFTVGDFVVVAGNTPTGYNGTYQITAVGSTTTFSYANTTTGSLTVTGTVTGTAQATIVTRNAATPGLIIKGAASQARGLLQFQNSSGTTLGGIDASAAAYFPRIAAGAGTTSPQVNAGWFTAPGATTVSVLVRGTTSQTADLLQYTDGSGNIYAGSNALGQSYTGTTAPITVATGGATTAASGTGTTATITTTTAHGLAVGDLVTVAGVTPTGYNGTYLVTAVTSTTFSYANTTTGSQTVSGTVSVPAQGSFTARSSGTVSLRIQSPSSGGQVANYFEIWDMTNNVLRASVNSNGTGYFQGGMFAGGSTGGSYRASVMTNNPVVTGLGIRGSNTSGVATQTADLLNFQTGATGNALIGGFNALAQSYTGSTAPITVATGGATTATSGDGTTATITTTSAHGLAVGDLVTVAGVTPTGYNGTFLVTAVGSTTTFSYANTTTGSQTVAGTVRAPAQASITARSAGTVGLVVVGASGQINDLQQWRDGTSTVQSYIGSAGDFISLKSISVPGINQVNDAANGRIAMTTTGIQLTTSKAANVLVTIQNTNATPTGNLTEWKNTGGTVVSSVETNGAVNISPSAAINGYSLYVGGSGSAGVITAKATATSAHLLQMSNSSNTVVAKVDRDGNAQFASIDGGSA